mmetsp:Transcript_35214/g.72523  ORF Transcript_35214/g.72523 Transcript_35214/m.72523 type:complete len:248 (-) Transcript_35214:32-775(-)
MQHRRAHHHWPPASIPSALLADDGKLHLEILTRLTERLQLALLRIVLVQQLLSFLHERARECSERRVLLFEGGDSVLHALFRCRLGFGGSAIREGGAGARARRVRGDRVSVPQGPVCRRTPKALSEACVIAGGRHGGWTPVALAIAAAPVAAPVDERLAMLFKLADLIIEVALPVRRVALLGLERRDLLLERSQLPVRPLHDAVFATQLLQRRRAHAVLLGNLIERHVEMLAQLFLGEDGGARVVRR